MHDGHVLDSASQRLGLQLIVPLHACEDEIAGIEGGGTGACQEQALAREERHQTASFGLEWRW